MKNREMLQHLPAEVSTELSLNYLVLTLKHHKCMENKIFRVMKLALTTRFIFTTGLLASVRSQNMRIDFILTYIIHSGFISGYQNRYGDNLKPPTNVYHRMTA